MNQLLGIRVLRVVQDLVGEPLLDDFAVEHDDGAIRQHTDDRQVVAHEHDRNIKFLAQLTNQFQHLRLYRKVQAGGDLIQEENGRIVCQCLGNLHTLLRPTAEVLWWLFFTGLENFYRI